MLQEDLGEGTLRPRAEHSGQRHHVRKCENYSDGWAVFGEGWEDQWEQLRETNTLCLLPLKNTIMLLHDKVQVNACSFCFIELKLYLAGHDYSSVCLSISQNRGSMLKVAFDESMRSFQDPSVLGKCNSYNVAWSSS